MSFNVKMFYNSWEPTRLAAQRSATSRKLRCCTDPVTLVERRRALRRTQCWTSFFPECPSSGWFSTYDGASTCSSNNTGLDKTTGRKRKSSQTDSEEVPSKRRRESPDSAGVIPDLFSDCDPEMLAKSGDEATFETKYRTEKVLGKGAYGMVYSGYRREDNLPVAIKYALRDDAIYIRVPIDGEMKDVPLEVILLCKANPAASKTSSAVALLDWYEEGQCLIMVMERPVPCSDLWQYVHSQGSSMTEEKAKFITKQLVDATIELHSRGVFHADIKTDNILIETGSSDPRVRIIDLGISMFILNANPQDVDVDWITEQRAEDITVDQLGSTVSQMLVRHQGDFDALSSDCQDFLRMCRMKKTHVSLKSLRKHPWLV